MENKNTLLGMEGHQHHHIERESGALGGLFQQIIQDMKNGMPLWEDLIAKAAKLHSSLKATILAVTAYLEAFQKIADSATNARGATREIGTALTRICLRHKAVEARMKTFTSTIMELLIIPLQDKLEDWKKTVLNLDKEHAKDYKRARSELKKRSTDTLRLQKKMRKGAGGDLQKRLECGLQDVTERRQLLEETEKHAVRAALIEERGRFCTFVSFLKPVVDEEIAMLTEMSHLQEAVQQLEKHAADPHILPPASEQVIADLKSSDASAGGWSFQTPPSSPSSLGSRKSSMCSISSLNSSSSGSSKSHQHSPSHPHWQRSLSQPVGRSGTIRYMSVSSQDSGFTSQDTLYPRPPSSLSVAQVSNMSEHSSNSSSSSTPCTPFPATTIPPTTTSTWPNLQETIQFERAASAIINDRPHTISSAYEKGHQRPPLTVYTFQAPDQSGPQQHQSLSQPVSPVTTSSSASSNNSDTTPSSGDNNSSSTKTIPPKSPATSVKSFHSKPPLPTRCSSLERPSGPNVPAKTIAGMQGVRVLPPTTGEQILMKKPSPLPAHLAKSVPQPTYVNMHELASMAASKAQEISLPPPPAEFINSPATEKPPNEGEKDGSTSESSLESSSGYGSQTTFTAEEIIHQEDVNETAIKYCTLPRNSDLFNAARRRPLSMTAMYSTGTMRNTLLRRGSMQTNKPPPPIRRTSSITNTSTVGQQMTSSMGSLENLPPPPAFLLEPSNNSPTVTSTAAERKLSTGIKVAETVKALTELKHTPASPNSIRRMSTSTQSIFQQSQQQQNNQQNSTTLTTMNSNSTANLLAQQHNIPQYHHQQQQIQSSNQQIQSSILSTFQQQTVTSGGGGQTKVSYVSQSGGVVYAQPSQILMQSTGGGGAGGGGGGGSPNLGRRSINSFRSQSAERKSGPGGVGSNFIASLSAKLTPNLSPRSSRRHSEDNMAAVQHQQQQQQQHNTIGGSGNLLQNKVSSGKGPGQSFLDSLNAKLAQQHIGVVVGGGGGHNQSSPQLKANKIRQLMNSKAQPDPKVCHESLMDQIKRGATLKRAKVINDRSAPKIY